MFDEWCPNLPIEDWTASFSGPIDVVPAEALDAAVHVLRLLPENGHVTLMTAHGEIIVERRRLASA